MTLYVICVVIANNNPPHIVSINTVLYSQFNNRDLDTSSYTPYTNIPSKNESNTERLSLIIK